MPSFTTARLPAPKSWDEFEDIVVDILKLDWDDPFPVRNGRQGQKQEGVDIYGKAVYLDSEYSGAQCKNSTITVKEVIKEIELAEMFQPPLRELIIATTSKRDSSLQEEIRLLDKERLSNGKFGIRILFWDDIQLILSENEDLRVKHFPQFVERRSSLDSIQKRIMESKIDDWRVSEDLKTYTYTGDTALFIKAEAFEQSREFYEEWLKKFPDSRGFTNNYFIFYSNSEVGKLFAVEVDGGRCIIPLPRHGDTLTITNYQYKLGRIVNELIYGRSHGFNTFDHYLVRAGISIRFAPD